MALHDQITLGVGAQLEDVVADDPEPPPLVERDGAGVALPHAQPHGAPAHGARVVETALHQDRADPLAEYAAIELAGHAAFGSAASATEWWFGPEADSPRRMPREQFVAHLTTIMMGVIVGTADALGIAISRPLQVYSGANTGALNSSFALANMPARESDVALGYVTTFLDGALALQANAAYQVNAAGTKGQTAVTGVARAKLNF